MARHFIEAAPPANEHPFDTELLPSDLWNQSAAKAKGWEWDSKIQRYVDHRGRPVADEKGQPLPCG